MKLPANSSYSYQIMNRSRHTVTKYINDDKTHFAINNKMFKRWNHINDKLHEVEMAKAEVEHKELYIVGFFILQNAKLRMLKLYYNFFYEFCVDTDSFYLFLAETNLYDCVKEDKKEVWELFVVRTAMTILLLTRAVIFFHAHAVKSTRNTTRKNRVFSRRRSGSQKCCASLARSFVAMMLSRTSISSAAKVSTSEHLRTAVTDSWPSVKKC